MPQHSLKNCLYIVYNNACVAQWQSGRLICVWSLVRFQPQAPILTPKRCLSWGCNSTGQSTRLLIWLSGFESSHPHQQRVFAISEETLKEYKETFVCSCREDRWKHNLILRDCRQRSQNTLLFFSKLQVVNEIRQHFIQIRPIFGIVTQLRRVSGS